MIYNKSYLSYIFKKNENDSPSVKSSNKKELVQSILKTEEDLKDNNKIIEKEYPIEFEVNKASNTITDIENRIEEIKETLQSKLIELRENISNCKLNVQEALLSERKLIGESYTAVIPLNKESSISDTTTATIENGIIFGNGFTTDKEGVIKIPLDSIYMKGEEDTEFSIENTKRINFKRNYYNSYQQIKITIPSINQTGLLHLELGKMETISILDKNGYEIISKTITNIVKFPITQTNNSFSIRIHDNSSITLDIKELYITEQVYNTQTVYESQPFSINENLTYFTVQTCDNYSNDGVNIQYEISINEEDYRLFRPNNKLKNNFLPSIISTNKNNYRDTIKLSKPVLDNGLYKFYTEDLVHSYTYNRGFSLKFGEDLSSLESFYEPNAKHFIMDEKGTPLLKQTKDYENTSILISEDSETLTNLFLITKENINIIFNNILEFEINGEKVNKTLVGETYTIKKGIYSLKFKKEMWKEFINLTDYKIYSKEGNYLTILNKSTGEKIETDIYYNEKEDINTSLYLQLFDKNCELYLKEEVLKKKYNDKIVEYFYKEDSYPLYVIGEDLSIKVSTVQFRITMNAEDKINCPFVSNITLRGI